GPARVQDVVHQHHRPPGDVEPDARLVHLRRFGPEPDVVAVEGDVQDPHRDVGALDAPDLRGQAPGQVVPPGGDADQGHAGGALVPFQDLVGDAGEGPADLRLVHQAGLRPSGSGARASARRCAHYEATPGRVRGRA